MEVDCRAELDDMTTGEIDADLLLNEIAAESENKCWIA
jgi:hypothetical protein